MVKFISPYHPQFRGVIGFAGHRSANKALSDPAADTVVVVGASLGEFHFKRLGYRSDA